MTLSLLVRPEVAGDVDDIRRYYRELSPHLEAAFEAAFKDAIARMTANPLAYSQVRGAMRRVRLKRFPYLVGYIVNPDSILVVGVVHAARDPEIWAARSGEPD